jgi:hypothetical protein
MNHVSDVGRRKLDSFCRTYKKTLQINFVFSGVPSEIYRETAEDR